MKEKKELERIYADALNCFHSGKHKQSIKLFKKLLGDGKDDAHCYHFLALNYAKLYKFKKAIALFDKSLKEHDDHLTHFNKGLTYYFSNIGEHKKEVYQKALNSVDKATRAKPHNAEYWYYRGVIHHRLKQYKKARAAFEIADHWSQGKIQNTENIKAFDEIKKKND